MHVTSAMPACSESAFVACNIYVSSASSNGILEKLLKQAQEKCRFIREWGSMENEPESIDAGLSKKDICRSVQTNGSSRMSPVRVVHAFADVPYNRSSFHLVGRSDCVADVALKLILNSFEQIEFSCDAKSDNAHPFVGLVDHVSVMPLITLYKSHGTSISTHTNLETNLHPSRIAAVDAAKAIGNGINNTRQFANVHYYGLACPKNTPLAQIRRDKTSFFNSDNKKLVSLGTKYAGGDCTIGVPFHFVENFNVRLSSNVDFRQAKTLTTYVRGRNLSTKGFGVEGVEALTLPYQVKDAAGNDKVLYEVACNLTNPVKGSALDIEEAVGNWVRQQQLPSCVMPSDATTYLIDKMYRVGTTEQQCIDILLKDCNGEGDESFDEHIFNQFQHYLK